MQQQPTDNITTLTYRMTVIEQSVRQLQDELRSYVPSSLNDVQLQLIRSTVERIQGDVKEAKDHVTSLSEQLTSQMSGLSTQITTQAKDQDHLQITVLKYVVGIVVTVLVALLIAHLTHFV